MATASPLRARIKQCRCGMRRMETMSTSEALATVTAEQGEPVQAAHLWGAAEALREAIGTPIPPAYRPGYKQAVAAARSQLGEEDFATDFERVLTKRKNTMTQDDSDLPMELAAPARRALTQ